MDTVSTDKTDQKKSFFQNEQLIIGIIIVATAVVYFNSLNNRFVYDDWFQIERNPLILSWENAPKLLTESVWQFIEPGKNEPVGPYYRPIFSFSLLVNYQLFGLNVVSWHLFSILFHLGTTLLVYYLAQEWTKSQKMAAIAAFIFGVHPVHTEAVVWASASTEVLLGFFTILSIFLYEKARNGGGIIWKWLIVSAVSALLAMGSKETGVMIPAFFLVREILDHFYNEGFNLKKSIIRIVPSGVCAAAYLIMRFYVLGSISAPNPAAKDITSFQMILTIPYLLFEYLRLNVIPYPLAFIYDYKFISSPFDLKFLSGMIFIAAAIYLIYRLGRNSLHTLLGAALFFIFLLPALNLKAFNPFQTILQDRYLYLPSAGFCIIVAVFIKWLVKKFGQDNEKVLIGMVLLIGLIYGGITIRQNRVWQNDFVLTEHALRYAPEWAFLYTNYGELHAERGDFRKAEENLEKAVNIGDNLAQTYQSLGFIYSKQEKLAEAEQALKKSIELGQSKVSVWINLGIVEIGLGKLDEAEFAFKTALNGSKGNPLALYNLGLIYDKRGDGEQAKRNFQKVLEIRPEFYDARLALAALLARENKFDEAIAQIEIVRRQNAENNDALLALGGIYLQNKQCEQAAAALNELVRRQPNHKRAYISLGISDECLGKIEDAKRSYEKAILIAPEAPATEVARRRLENLRKGIIEKIR